MIVGIIPPKALLSSSFSTPPPSRYPRSLFNFNPSWRACSATSFRLFSLMAASTKNAPLSAYSLELYRNVGKRLHVFTSYESRLIKGSIDFVGLNHYFIMYVKDNPNSLKTESRDMGADMASSLVLNTSMTSSPKGDIIQHSLWAQNVVSAPSGLQAVLEYIGQAYENPALYIHENGLPIPRNQSLNDTARVKYMHAHIGSTIDALRCVLSNSTIESGTSPIAAAQGGNLEIWKKL